MAQAKSYGAQLGAADSLLEPKLEPGHNFSTRATQSLGRARFEG